ncbi:MAG: hypothetical protein KAS57_06720 [Gammaproteobacteria bacterium]|nr:hypothetical protein [Gammaproteobacteria bacterium]
MAASESKPHNPVYHLRHKKLDYFGKPAPQVHFPMEPSRLEDLGLDDTMVHKMILKHLYNSGTLRTDELAHKLGVSVSIIDKPIAFLRNRALVETYHRNGKLIGDIMRYKLTESGRKVAHEHMEDNSYCGQLPVTYSDYCKQVSAQSIRSQIVDRKSLDLAFKDVVINPKILNSIGAAFNSGSSIFLYGPAGTGKSFIASKMKEMLQDNIAIPYAIEVEGQIIRLFDSNDFTPIVQEESDNKQSTQDPRLDRRWVICQRPVIVAAGELTQQMLDLNFDRDRGFYEAPLQMKANGGIFLIDDFGRQQMSSNFLLNRWIMPLENGIDYLGLHTGNKIKIPFDVIPVFSTNIEPRELVDEAFLRRLGYKIIVSYISEEEYSQIFKQYCITNGLEFSQKFVDYLIQQHYKPNKKKLLASHPKELINKVIDFSLFDNRKPSLSEESLSMAWDAFFMQETET